TAGYLRAKVIKEVGAEVNGARPKLHTLLEEQGRSQFVVEHKRCLTRVGHLGTLLKTQGTCRRRRQPGREWDRVPAGGRDGHCLLVLCPTLRATAGQAQDRGDCTRVGWQRGERRQDGERRCN